jgi:hypothetical protein
VHIVLSTGERGSTLQGFVQFATRLSRCSACPTSTLRVIQMLLFLDHFICVNRTQVLVLLF